MAQFGRSLGGGAILAVALALAACGEKAQTTAAATTVGGAEPTDIGGAEEYGPLDGGTAAGAITAIDAARGGGGVLPPDSHGPSAYDLARARTAHAERHEEVSGGATDTSAIGDSDDGSPSGESVIATPDAASDPAARP
jgi:opacity protein-like surface antigen